MAFHDQHQVKNMLEMFTDADPMRSDDYALPADGWRENNIAHRAQEGKAMSELMDDGIIRMPYEMAMSDELSRKQFYSRANSLLTEITEMRAKLSESAAEIKRLESAWNVETMSRKDRIIGDQEDENDRLRAKLDDKDRIIKEWQDLWMPIDDFVRPLAALGECVSTKALEMIKEHSEIKTKLAAMESQQPIAWASNKGETTINEIQVEYWERGGHEITPLYAKPVPADKSKYKAVTKSDLPLDPSREHLLNEAAKRADYFFRQVDGSYSFPAPDGQVAQIIEMLLAAANKPDDKPAVAVPDLDTAVNIFERAACHTTYKMVDGVKAVLDYAKSSPRITEQDAREAARSYAFYCMSEARGDAGTLADWIGSPEGRTLLNKLNEDREQVPAVAVPDCENIIRDLAQEFKEAWPDDNGKYAWLIGYSDEFKAAPSHSQQSARSPQHYAIEHAEYMAVSGEQLMDYLNEIASEDDGVLVPDDRFGDYIGGLRSGVYEFRKRRDRCPSHESEQSASPAPDSEGE